jgi:hypothetical protein
VREPRWWAGLFAPPRITRVPPPTPASEEALTLDGIQGPVEAKGMPLIVEYSWGAKVMDPVLRVGLLRVLAAKMQACGSQVAWLAECVGAA